MADRADTPRPTRVVDTSAAGPVDNETLVGALSSAEPDEEIVVPTGPGVSPGDLPLIDSEFKPSTNICLTRPLLTHRRDQSSTRCSRRDTSWTGDPRHCARREQGVVGTPQWDR